MTETMTRSKSIEGDLSWCGSEEALEYLSRRSPLVVGTLGPKGTSSEYAANYFVDQFAPNIAGNEIELFDSFQDLEVALCQGDVALAVVPHAYARINDFYVNPEVDLLLVFICSTPTYGLVRRKDVQESLQESKLVTHPAPLPLLPHLLRARNPQKFDVELVSSTSVAARRVREGSADLAITNERAAREHGLELVATYGPIRMSWSIFILRK